MRRSHVQHDTARVPRRTPFWPKPQKGAKTLFPVHPAALINEPPAPHRERQVAAKGGMLQTRSRPQSSGFRPPVLITTAKRQRAPDVGRPTCGAPDAAESVEQKPLPPHAAGVRKSAFPADTRGGRTSDFRPPVLAAGRPTVRRLSSFPVYQNSRLFRDMCDIFFQEAAVSYFTANCLSLRTKDDCA